MAGLSRGEHEERSCARVAAALNIAIVVSALAVLAVAYYPRYSFVGVLIDLAHAPAMGIYGVAMVLLLALSRQRRAMIAIGAMAALLTPMVFMMLVYSESSSMALRGRPSDLVLYLFVAAATLAVAAGGRFAIDRRWAWLPMGLGALASLGMGALVARGPLAVGEFSLLALPMHLALVWTLFAATFDRDPRPGSCLGCGYDMAGVPGATCPECGAHDRRAPAANDEAPNAPLTRAALAGCTALAAGYAGCVANTLGFSGDLDDAHNFIYLPLAMAFGLLASLTLPDPRRWYAGAMCLVAAVLVFVIIALLGERYEALHAGDGAGGLTWTAAVLLLVLALPMALPALIAARSWRGLLLTALAMDLSMALALLVFHALGGSWVDPLLGSLTIPWLAALWLLAAHAAQGPSDA